MAAEAKENEHTAGQSRFEKWRWRNLSRWLLSYDFEYSNRNEHEILYGSATSYPINENALLQASDNLIKKLESGEITAWRDDKKIDPERWRSVTSINDPIFEKVWLRSDEVMKFLQKPSGKPQEELPVGGYDEAVATAIAIQKRQIDNGEPILCGRALEKEVSKRANCLLKIARDAIQNSPSIPRYRVGRPKNKPK